MYKSYFGSIRALPEIFPVVVLRFAGQSILPVVSVILIFSFLNHPLQLFGILEDTGSPNTFNQTNKMRKRELVTVHPWSSVPARKICGNNAVQQLRPDDLYID